MKAFTYIKNYEQLPRKVKVSLIYVISTVLMLVITICNRVISNPFWRDIFVVNANHKFIPLVVIGLAVIILTIVFAIKCRSYLWHYLLCLAAVVVALSNYNLFFVLLFVLSLTFFFTFSVKWFAIVPLASFLSWALLKRVVYLGDKCYWWDEFLTEMRVWLPCDQILKEPMTVRCLLYSFLLKFYASTISAFNHHNFLTEFQLRLPHAIVGALALFVVYLIGRKLKDEVTGILMILFASISYFLVYFSREARFYPLVLLFSACLIHALVLIINRDKDCKRSCIILYYVYYALTAICGMHTHQGFWLLFAASNVFLGVFELVNLIFCSSDKKKDLLLLIPIFLLLFLPLLSVCPILHTLLDKGSDSNIIKGQKLVPHLDNSFFISVHRELWKGLKYRDYMHFIVLVALIILLLFKKTRIISLYLLTVTIFTFVSLRNMGQFREPFRVKYITYLYLIEMSAAFLAFTVLIDFSLSWLKNRKVAFLICSVIFAFTFLYSQKDLVLNISLPKGNKGQPSFRTLAETLNNNVKAGDIIVSGDEGCTALQYYRRFYSAAWSVIRDNQIQSIYKGNYICGGFSYCLFSKKTANKNNSLIFKELASDSDYSLFKSAKCLDKSLQNALVLTLFEGFKDSNKLPIKQIADRLYYTDDLIKNGDFTEGLSGWRISHKSGNDIILNTVSNGELNYLNITNNTSNSLVISQTLHIPTGGLYAFTFKASGFNNNGNIGIKSNEENKYLYKDELNNCLFTRFTNLKFSKPQDVTISLTIRHNDYANLYNLGFYKLEKRQTED